MTCVLCVAASTRSWCVINTRGSRWKLSAIVLPFHFILEPLRGASLLRNKWKTRWLAVLASHSLISTRQTKNAFEKRDIAKVNVLLLCVMNRNFGWSSIQDDAPEETLLPGAYRPARRGLPLLLCGCGGFETTDRIQSPPPSQKDYEALLPGQRYNQKVAAVSFCHLKVIINFSAFFFGRQRLWWWQHEAFFLYAQVYAGRLREALAANITSDCRDQPPFHRYCILEIITQTNKILQNKSMLAAVNIECWVEFDWGK